MLTNGNVHTETFVRKYLLKLAGRAGRRQNAAVDALLSRQSQRPVGKKSIAPMLSDFMDVTVDELHSETTILNFAEVPLLERFAEKFDVAVGVIDVKSYYIETPDDVAERIRKCLPYVPAEKLAVAPDCGLSQTARWAAKQKLANMVAGAKLVRAELGLA